MTWLVFDVGCIECHEESAVVGLFDSEEEAQKAAREYGSGPDWGRPEWSGQHSVEVFDLAAFEGPGLPVRSQTSAPNDVGREDTA